jgi:hypothetical protein
MAFRPEEITISEYPIAEFGDFKHRLLFDAVNLNFDHYQPEHLFGGLPQQAVWGYATLEDADGNVYVFVREMPPGSTNGLGLFSDKGGLTSCRFVEECMTSYRGIMLVEKSREGITWTSADRSVLEEPSLVISHDGETLHWREKGILELEGRALSPGYQWLDAAPGNQAYAAQMHRVSGTVLGKPVDGWVGLDVLYLAPGKVYGTSPMAKGLVLSWAAFATEFDDGGWEHGFIMKGFGNFSAALIINDKYEISRASWVDAEYQQDDDGFPTSIRFSFKEELTGEDQAWNWTPHPHGNLVDIPLMQPEVSTYRGAAATMTRDGESRKVVSSFGWPDFYGDERVGMYNRLRGERKK